MRTVTEGMVWVEDGESSLLEQQLADLGWPGEPGFLAALGNYHVLLPRLSPSEVESLGRLRGPIGGVAVPAASGGGRILQQAQIRDLVAAHYRRQLDEPSLVHYLDGVKALADVATVACVYPWLSEDDITTALRPLRDLIGPANEEGLGPRAEQVRDVIKQAALLGGWQHARVRAHWEQAPPATWQALEESLALTASTCSRMASIRVIQRHLASGANLPEPTRQAAYLKATAIMMGDLTEMAEAAAAHRVWDAAFAKPGDLAA